MGSSDPDLQSIIKLHTLFTCRTHNFTYPSPQLNFSLKAFEIPLVFLCIASAIVVERTFKVQLILFGSLTTELQHEPKLPSG